MKLLIAIVFALAVTIVNAQLDVVGFWGGEICESYKGKYYNIKNTAQFNK